MCCTTVTRHEVGGYSDHKWVDCSHRYEQLSLNQPVAPPSPVMLCSDHVILIPGYHNIRGSLHYKQDSLYIGNIILQLSVANVK